MSWWNKILSWFDGSSSSKSPPAFGKGTISGYGPVNIWWKMSDSTLKKILARMDKKNVRYFPVEAVGNASEDVLGVPAKMETVKKKYKLVLAECRRLGIWFAPILFNDNAGKGNWMNGGVALSQRMGQARAFIDWIAEQGGKSHLVITPVGETRTSAGSQLEAYAAQKLAGFRLCTNHGSRPQSPAAWSQYACYHPFKTSEWPTGKSTHVLSDTGTILAALNLGNDPYNEGNPAALKSWIAAGVKRGQAVVAYYAFQTDIYDEKSIDAMGVSK